MVVLWTLRLGEAPVKVCRCAPSRGGLRDDICWREHDEQYIQLLLCEAFPEQVWHIRGRLSPISSEYKYQRTVPLIAQIKMILLQLRICFVRYLVTSVI